MEHNQEISDQLQVTDQVKKQALLAEAAAHANEKMEPGEWREEYQYMLDNPPESGDFLLPKVRPDESDSALVKLEIECVPGRPPFIFARAYVPNIVGERPNWYVHDKASKACHGWKAVLHPKSRDEVIRKFGIKDVYVFVKRLRVIRKSVTGQSLVCEVDEW